MKYLFHGLALALCFVLQQIIYRMYKFSTEGRINDRFRITRITIQPLKRR